MKRQVDLIPLLIAVVLYVGLLVAGAFGLVAAGSAIMDVQMPSFGLVLAVMAVSNLYFIGFNKTIAAIFGGGNDGK